MKKSYSTPVILFLFMSMFAPLNAQALSGPAANEIVDEAPYEFHMTSTEPEATTFKASGTGVLENGVAKISIDSELSKHIIVDSDHPLQIFIQLEGENNGVYVTNRSTKGFWVKEFSQGASNSKFTWKVVGKRIK